MRRATRSTSAADWISGKNRVNSSPARRASSGLRQIGFRDLRGDDDAEPVRDHDQQLVAAGMAEAVVDHLEAVEVDEQHRAAASGRGIAEQLVGFRAEMQPVGKRRDRVVHAQRLRILDRGANLGEQGVHRGGQLGHVLAGRAPAAARPDRRPRPQAAGRRAPTERGRFRCWDAPTRCS